MIECMRSAQSGQERLLCEASNSGMRCAERGGVLYQSYGRGCRHRDQSLAPLPELDAGTRGGGAWRARTDVASVGDKPIPASPSARPDARPSAAESSTCRGGEAPRPVEGAAMALLISESRLSRLEWLVGGLYALVTFFGAPSVWLLLKVAAKVGALGG